MTKPVKIPKALSPGEESLATQLKHAGILFDREYRFAPPRRWRFDFALAKMLAVEIEGGGPRGRHSRFNGFEDDCRKYNAAAHLGWRVLRFTTRMATSGEAINVIKEALKA